MFEMFGVIFLLFFFLFFAIFFLAILKIIKEWNKNNKSPRLKVEAKVVDKREHISRNTHRHNGHTHTSHSSSYFITFEVESGDRLELQIPRDEFGLIIEGDFGDLTFQGTRFVSFERK